MANLKNSNRLDKLEFVEHRRAVGERYSEPTSVGSKFRGRSVRQLLTKLAIDEFLEVPDFEYLFFTNEDGFLMLNRRFIMPCFMLECSFGMDIMPAGHE